MGFGLQALSDAFLGGEIETDRTSKAKHADKVKKNSVFEEQQAAAPRTLSWGEGFKNQEGPVCKGSVVDIQGQPIGSFMLSASTDFNCTETVGAEKMFRLNSPMTFCIDYEDKNGEIKQYNITIPEGYEWDGASIPSMFQDRIGQKNEPKFMVPSLLHDYLCENKGLVDKNRALSSCVFKEMLLNNDVDDSTAMLMYGAVETYQYAVPGWDREQLAQNTTDY